MEKIINKISGDSIVVTRSLFQEKEGSSILTSPHQLRIKHIGRGEAEQCYRLWHYLGEKGFMSSYNFGVFFGDELLGCISYGVPNAIEMEGLFTRYNQKGWWEIKRFALSPLCPKNSESRMIAVSLRILRKLEPTLKGIITYADSGVGHTGTIYRASGFSYKGLTAQKTDLFIDGKIAGKKGQYRRVEKEREEWRARSRKHLFIKQFTPLQ